MDRSLQDVTILCYLDDICIISESFEKHLEVLQKVFDRLRTFGLRADRVKCSYALKNSTYLGHVVAPQTGSLIRFDGIKPDSSRINAILKIKEPTNIKHLK